MIKELFYNLFHIGQGIIITLELLLSGVSIGIILGLLICLARYKGIMKFFLNRLISIIRGTPLILQLSFIYFAVPSFTQIKLSIITSGIITFGINSSAYIAEILRGGIESINRGQFEAAQTLKIPPYYMWKDIILPQVIKNVLPSMTGEIIALLKETALIATIGGMDIMRSAQAVAAERFTYFLPLCVAGLYYYILVILIEYFGKTIEKKMQYSKS